MKNVELIINNPVVKYSGTMSSEEHWQISGVPKPEIGKKTYWITITSNDGVEYRNTILRAESVGIKTKNLDVIEAILGPPPKAESYEPKEGSIGFLVAKHGLPLLVRLKHWPEDRFFDATETNILNKGCHDERVQEGVFRGVEYQGSVNQFTIWGNEADDIGWELRTNETICDGCGEPIPKGCKSCNNSCGGT